MFRFNYNGNKCGLNLEENYILIGKEKFELSDEELKHRKRIYYKITEACNLNCIYCFQKNDDKYSKDLEVNEYDKIISKHFKESDLEIIIFGGEPFIDKNIDNLKYLFSKADELNKLSFFTNGCYSNEITNLIGENKKKIKGLTISIDGPEMIHNKRRPYVGNNSYKTILNNIFDLKKECIPFLIQVNVDSKNIDSIETLMDDLDSEFGLSNLEIVLNRVLRDNNSINEIELLVEFIHLIKKYDYAHLDINSRLYKNLAEYVSGNGFYKSRCGIGDTTIIFDFIKNKLYSCPQDITTEIGTFNKNEFTIDDIKKCEMCNVSRKNNENVKNADL